MMKHLKTYENNDDEIKFDWEKFKEYVNTYEPMKHGNNNWRIILDDMLYGLGLSLDDKEFKMADGYKKFKQYLKDEVNWKLKKQADKYNL